MSAHTPGPWEMYQDVNGYGIVGICGGYRGDIDNEADARLIAAAPELLAALSRLRNAETAPRDEWVDALKNADAAIAKATGETA